MLNFTQPKEECSIYQCQLTNTHTKKRSKKEQSFDEAAAAHVDPLTLQIHLFSFCEHLIAPAASRAAGVIVLISCLENTDRKTDLASWGEKWRRMKPAVGQVKLSYDFQAVNLVPHLLSAALASSNSPC